MSTSSADPVKLGAFVTRAEPGRGTASTEQVAVAALQRLVYDASPDYHIEVGSLAALATLLETMEANQAFVATVRTELLAADASATGPVTVSDASVASALTKAGAGTPPPSVEFDPAALVGLPPTSGFVDDPICAANGNMVHQDTDAVFPAIAGALDLVRTWNSVVHDRPGSFGPGWSSVLDMGLDLAPGEIRARLADGATVAFVPAAEGAVARGRRRLRLERAGDGWRLHADPTRSFAYDAEGRLTGWSVGVARVSVTRGEGGRVIGLHEQVTGRSLGIAWADGQVESVSTDDGRTVAYTRGEHGVITAARSHAGSLAYSWDGTLLTAVLDADGVAAFVNHYDERGRVVEQTSPFGRVTTYRYDPSGSTVITDGDGVRQAMIHDRAGNLVAVVDTDGSAMRLTYDDADRVVRVVERDGAEWRYNYDDRDDLVRRVDPDGLEQRWEWDDQHRLVRDIDRAGAITTMVFDEDHRAPSRVIGPDGAEVAQTLDDRGLPIEIVDADGVVSRFAWDGDGQLVAAVDGSGGATSLDYDEHGLLVRLAPAEGATTVLRRDDAGRVVRTERADAVTTYAYTDAGRVRAGVEPGDVSWSATFGPHGALASLSDATGATARFDHDAIGNVAAVTAPDGAVYRTTYDEVGRPVAIVEPTGATTTKGYDIGGRLVTFTDAEGGRWERRLDVLGRTVESVAPDGGVTRWTYHPNGEIATLTGPDGRTWTTEIDLAGRPVAVVDPAGGRAEIEYTPAGRLRRRTSPAGRTETFEHDGAGRLHAVTGVDGVRRALERDRRGSITAVVEADGRVGLVRDDADRVVGLITGEGATAIERDNGGRVVGTVDPTGVSSTFTWDQRGLLTSATDPAGLATAYEHDGRGRLAAQIAPGGRRIGAEYGVDGRLAALTDPAGAVTRFTRDANGAVTGVRGGDGSGWDRTLDPLGRETERVGTDGIVHDRYDYDAAGRLVSAVAAGADVPVAFLWDDTDAVVGVTTVEGTSTVERDADGWVVATTTADGERTVYERDATGRIVALRMGGDGDGDAIDVPNTEDVERDRAGRLTIGPDGTLSRYDDAGRIAEIVPVDGVATRFTYDADGLVATEDGPSGTRRFGYDRAGRVVTVTIDGVGTTTIDYDGAGRRSREHRPDGSVVSYRWDSLDRLIAIVRDGEQLDIVYDSLSRPVVVDGARVGYDPASGTVDRIGASRWLVVGAARYDIAAGAWVTPTPDRPNDGVPVDGLVVLGARVLDPATHQFLSPDPLLAVAGTNGAASAYTYAWHDPVNHVDPTGLKPVSIEDYAAIRAREEQGRLGQAWEAIKEDPWGTLAMVGVVALGVGLCFVPGGQVIGAGILVGAAMSAGVGLATGEFSPTGVAIGGAFGALPGGSTVRGAVMLGAAGGAGETVATSVLSGEGIPSASSVVLSTATLGLAGGAGRHVDQLLPSGSSVSGGGAPSNTRVYRVEGPGNARLDISPSGDVGITGNRMLFLNFGDEARADEFLQIRLSQGHPDVIKSFDVPTSYVDQLRATAVLEKEAAEFPHRPLHVDVNKGHDQYGLRRHHIDELRLNIVPGSGRHGK